MRDACSRQFGGEFEFAIQFAISGQVFEHALLLGLLNSMVGGGSSSNRAANQRKDAFAELVEKEFDKRVQVRLLFRRSLRNAIHSLQEHSTRPGFLSLRFGVLSRAPRKMCF